MNEICERCGRTVRGGTLKDNIDLWEFNCPCGCYWYKGRNHIAEANQEAPSASVKRMREELAMTQIEEIEGYLRQRGWLVTKLSPARWEIRRGNATTTLNDMKAFYRWAELEGWAPPSTGEWKAEATQEALAESVKRVRGGGSTIGTRVGIIDRPELGVGPIEGYTREHDCDKAVVALPCGRSTWRIDEIELVREDQMEYEEVEVKTAEDVTSDMWYLHPEFKDYRSVQELMTDSPPRFNAWALGWISCYRAGDGKFYRKREEKPWQGTGSILALRSFAPSHIVDAKFHVIEAREGWQVLHVRDEDVRKGECSNDGSMVLSGSPEFWPGAPVLVIRQREGE